MRLLNRLVLTQCISTALLIYTLSGCATAPQIQELKQKEKGNETGEGNFVILSNGEKRTGRELKFIYKSFKKRSIKLDGEEIAWQMVKAYQDENGYYAKCTDPDFKDLKIQRVRKGKMNLYVDENKTRSQPRSGITGTWYDYYFFEVTPDKHVKITYDRFASALADNAAALAELRKLYPKHKITVDNIYDNAINLAKIVEVYNGVSSN